MDYEGMDLDAYFDCMLGVTRSEKDNPQNAVLFVSKFHAPYVQTNPLQHTQQVLENDENRLLMSIGVIVNFELEREILSFGGHMRVVAPRSPQTIIQKRLEKARDGYQ